MSVSQFYKATFRAVVKNPANVAGPVYKYVGPTRSVMLAAASGHPADILVVLNADITLNPNETLELLSAFHEPGTGSEGDKVYS